MADNLIKAKWEVYKNALGDCQSGVKNLGIFATTYVDFDFGQIYHSPHGISAIYGAIYQLFKAENGMGKFGFPLRDEEDINDVNKGYLGSWNKSGYTRVSKFEKGVIVWGPNKGAKALTTEKFNEGPHSLLKKETTVDKTFPIVEPKYKAKKTTQAVKSIKIEN